ncbi:hypothetical protein [Yinghuangia sp. YIM S10712]|uniref:hypothetical protein n=1 Tax=Yinghuangia sp. YIM S10712 TaxID=3436930 RepID=UPI003F53BD17
MSDTRPGKSKTSGNFKAALGVGASAGIAFVALNGVDNAVIEAGLKGGVAATAAGALSVIGLSSWLARKNRKISPEEYVKASGDRDLAEIDYWMKEAAARGKEAKYWGAVESGAERKARRARTEPGRERWGYLRDLYHLEGQFHRYMEAAADRDASRARDRILKRPEDRQPADPGVRRAYRLEKEKP